MKPILKWPGGKARELRRIRPLVPEHDLLVEPFFGGGALFFALEPRAASVNDTSCGLMAFYRAVQTADERFRSALRSFARDRDRLSRRAEREAGDFGVLVARARMGKKGIGHENLVRKLESVDLDLAVRDVGRTIGAAVADKAVRLVRLEKKHDVYFCLGELGDHYETALQAGYYTAVRDLHLPEDPSEATARFFFLRQLCYGAMFRYSKTGRFNIPYGGITYNRIQLEKKADRLLSGEVHELLARAELHCEDFEVHLESLRERLDDRAFVFFDPPYDTEFSGYANRTFGPEDHRRLAGVFAELPCPALLVIKRSPLIDELYEEVAAERKARGLPFFRKVYGKQYGYNVRGRNDRKATHLLMGNYLPPSRTRTGSPSHSAR